jgi:hypothetical protein
MLDVIWQILLASWQMLGQMAPLLLLGFLIAGALSVGMAAEWLQRHLGRGGIKPVIKATLLGVPLPLCSCGVIPVTASMRRHGASRAATAAFLLSTPQTGIDSILDTYLLLGGAFAIFRPLAALVTGIIGGIMVLLMGKDHAEADPPKNRALTPQAGEHTHRLIPVQILRYGFVTLPREIDPALMVGILIAGALSALVPVGGVSTYIGGGIVSILIMMTAGIPMYVCATASVPIAAGLLLTLLIGSRLLRDKREGDATIRESAEERLELQVSGMYCTHCVTAIDDAVRSCPRVSAVNVDLKTGSVQVYGTEINEEQVVSTIDALGYAVSRPSSLNE